MEKRKKFLNFLNEHNIKYISFDLYDTLIYRCVDSPLDVFDVIESRYNFVHKVKLHNFRKMRIVAENIARSKKKYDDIIIDDIYRFLKLDKKISSELQKIEKQVEIELSVPNRNLIEILNKYKKNHEIVITTDMYLDKLTISSILQKNKIDYDYLFISGECGCSKETGQMYRHLLNSLKTHGNNVVHLGDNWNKDIVNAKKQGIFAFQVKREKGSFIDHYEHNRREDIATKIQRNYFSLQEGIYDSKYYEIGYSVLGPFLVELCRWIHASRIKDKINRLWFVAREGYLIMRVYEQLYPNEKEKISYVRLNKNVCKLPYLYKYPDIDSLIYILPKRESYTVEFILEYIFGANNYKYICEVEKNIDINIYSSFSYDDLKNGTRKHEIIFILNLIKRNGKGQYDKLMDYISLYSKEHETIGLINNSMSGNLQYMLNRLINKQMDISLKGIQFVKSSNFYHFKLDCRAWFEEVNVGRYYTALFYRTALVLEHLLFESVGTALRFSNNYRDNDLVLVDTQGEEIKNNIVISEIQELAIKFSKDFKAIPQIDYTQASIKRYFSLLINPTFEDAQVIGNLVDYNNGISRKIVNEQHLDNINGYKLLKYSRYSDYTYWANGFFVLNHIGDFIKKTYAILVYLRELL